MKIILEGPSVLTGSYEDEINEATGQTERNYYISGIFSTPDVKNRNGRVYPRSLWEREVARYQNEIANKTTNSLGEWQHPPRETVDPLKAVIRIVELRINEEGNVVGKAKILNNNSEITNKLKSLIKEGIRIGVSSRGVGSVGENGIVETYRLVTYDVVDLPSDYNAMLTGMVEGVEVKNGIVLDKEYEINKETGCVGEVCNKEKKKMNDNNLKQEIDEMYSNMVMMIENAKEEVKNEIYDKISEYLDGSTKEPEGDIEKVVKALKTRI